jgi:hypothetical protein
MDFAADETDGSLGAHVDLDALRATPGMSDEETAVDPKVDSRRVARAALTGVGLLVGANLLAVVLGMITRSWALFQYGWPAELLLVAILLLLLMSAIPSIWLMIPGGILMGNGLLFGFYALTGFWAGWEFLWPLEPLLVLGVIVSTIVLGRSPGQGRAVARKLGLGLAGIAGVTVVAIAWVSLVTGAFARFFQ